MIRRAKDLSAAQRLAVESLLGRAISDQDEISIRTLPDTLVSVERRREIIDALRRHFEEVDSKRQQIPMEEVETTINEALRSTRPNYRPLD